MPILKDDLSQMGVKEYADNRHKVDERVNQLKRDKNVFAKGKT